LPRAARVASSYGASMTKRAVRIGVYVLIAFVIGSLILGTIKGNAFVGNVVYGLWTGAIAGAVVTLVYAGVSVALQRQRA
jgi:hypothetical protein